MHDPVTNEHDLNAADRLITAPVEVVFADVGYRGAEKRESLLERVKYWFIARGPHAVKNLRQHPSRYKQALLCIQHVDIGVKYNFL